MASPALSSATPPMLHQIHHSNMDVDKLTNQIFSILENKFLFGYHDHHHSPNNHHFSSSPKVRILSIDATHALLAAKTLLHFQSILRRKSGNPNAQIADFFDVVTGAGAGGVLAALLFTRGKNGSPMFTADDSLKFMLDNCRLLTHYSPSRLFRRPSKAEKVLKKLFGDLTLKDTLKPVLIPCYDLRTGAPFLFSRADALEMEGCDFRMAGVCGATVADRAMELKSTDGTKKILAVGGGVGMSNPTAAAITHVLNNKQEFPLCRGVEDLLVLSLGNGESHSHSAAPNRAMSSPAAFLKIAADGAADMVDQAVSMAFGEWRRSNYVRVQGNGRLVEEEKRRMLSMVDEILGEKNVESILFKGKKMVEFTNMEKVEMFAGEEHTTLNPNGVTVEKGNVLQAKDVLLQIRGSVVLRQIGLFPVQREFVCQDFFAEGDGANDVFRKCTDSKDMDFRSRLGPKQMSILNGGPAKKALTLRRPSLLLKLISELGDACLLDLEEAVRVLSHSPVLENSSSARVLATRRVLLVLMWSSMVDDT
ncbi:UNVERIFIED_CONTAM: Patatin-like protein 7 [Sesamum calycinum]|uniref:Patatin-like protein 7 n=1 Tax=Sesamum calycinum TaxID=2727403 RepID=A0AAW2RWF4_9LAMI